MSNEYNDEILEQAWERALNERYQELLEELLAINDLEGIYYDS